MNKNWLKKVHQSFNVIERIQDSDLLTESYCYNINKYLYSINYCEKVNLYEFENSLLVEYFKKFSIENPFLVFSIFKESSINNLLKIYFWNGYVFFDDSFVNDNTSTDFFNNGIYVSIFFDYNSVDYFEDDIYKLSLIKSGEIVSSLKSICFDNKFDIKYLKCNDNSITRQLNFNITELAHLTTVILSGCKDVF